MITLLSASSLPRLLIQLRVSAGRLGLISMSITPECIAAFTAMAVFLAALFAFYSASARREREAARRQWQADLRARGA
jgi:hypothetical protein